MYKQVALIAYIVVSFILYSLLAMSVSAVYVKHLLVLDLIMAVSVFSVFLIWQLNNKTKLIATKFKEPIFNIFKLSFIVFICYDTTCNLLLTFNFLQRNDFSTSIIELMKSEKLNLSYYISTAFVLVIIAVSNYILKKLSNNDKPFKEILELKISLNILCVITSFLLGITIGIDFYSESFITALTKSSHFSFISGTYFSLSLLLILFMYTAIVSSAKQKINLASNLETEKPINTNNENLIGEDNQIEKKVFFANFKKLLDFYSFKTENLYKDLNDLLEELQSDENKEPIEKSVTKIVETAQFKSNEGVIDDIVSNMVLCRSGEFVMGSPEDEKGRGTDEKQHTVSLTKDFYLSKYVVTNWHYRTIINKKYDYILDDLDKPITNISWFEAKNFCKILNNLFSDKIPNGYKFDLPTEAQWEYACRAGSTKAFSNGIDLPDNIEKPETLDEIAWFDCNYVRSVGLKKPNLWGFYDMNGNVWEWCNDWYGDYKSDNETDPTGNAEGTYKVIRGGCVTSYASDCRLAKRNYEEPDVKDKYIGFRLALVATE